MASGLARYGLKVNPYKFPIDPLEDEEHANWLVRVDGFAELDRIDNYIQENASDIKPLFFMVTGKSGSGRTSVAKFIMARYRFHRGVDSRQFVPVINEAEDDDEFNYFQNWLIDLYFKLSSLEVKPTLPKNLTVEDINRAQRNTMRATFHGLMMQFNMLMKTAKEAGQLSVCYGCFVDNVKTSAFIDAAERIFRDSGTVCVFTAGDYKETEDALTRPFTETFGSQAVIRLSDLSGAQVKDLVNARWSRFSKYDIPFDLAGVEKTFEARARSVGRVLEIFSKLMVVKVPEKVDGPSWPQAADLRHNLDDLKHYLGIIDGY